MRQIQNQRPGNETADDVRPALFTDPDAHR
jgi:hypothetical protein